MVNIHKCMLCGCRRFILFDRRNHKGHEIDNYICLRCGIIFMSPRMDENELKRFYAVDYHRLYQDQEEPSSADLIVQQRRAEHFAELLYSLLGACTTHLDIG